MCRNSRHTTLLLSGIAGLECRVVKMAKQGTGPLFTGAENLARLAWCSCSIPWIKPLSAFANVVEGNLLNNFGIQGLGHFSLNVWRKFGLNKAKRNCLDSRRSRARRRPRAATSVTPYPAPARTPRRRQTQRSEARVGDTVH
jgi:hypothetical protein